MTTVEQASYYARYYVGQKFWFRCYGGFKDTDVIQMVSDNGNDVFGLKHDLFFWHEGKNAISEFKLILRPTWRMTKIEQVNYKKLCKQIRPPGTKLVYTVDTPLSLVYLLENGFDVFDLIEKGLAFDSKKFKHSKNK